MSNIKRISSIADISDTTSIVSEDGISATIFIAGEDDMPDIDDMELMYDTEMISKILGVQSSTLRKYCALMQKYGYEFNKNSVGYRIFYKKDILIIQFS